MVADRAGNSRNQARNVDPSTLPKTFTDLVGKSDPKDLYQIKLTSSSSLGVSLKSSNKNIGIALLNAAGKVLKQTVRNGKASTTIKQTLNPDTYYVQVVPQHRKSNARYQLSLQTQPTATATKAGQQSGDSSFDIEFDYRFDNGWFTPERKAALEAAANVWERVIQDEFSQVPIGAKTPIIANPRTGEVMREFVTDRPIDDVMIFVGARSLPASTLAMGGPSGDPPNELRYSGADFEPWLGSITFNSTENWFFDPTPATRTDVPSSQYDFISTAAHEIGHVLGFLGGTAGVIAFKQQAAGSTFSGANAKALNGGNPIPLDSSSSSHIQDSYQFGGSGEALMSPRASSGVRKLPTVLDLAVLDDLGYTVDYSKAARNGFSGQLAAQRSASRQSPTKRSARLTASLSSDRHCGCSACLMG